MDNTQKNPDLAKNLKGHLLLTTGDIDNNVHPGNTIRVANALIKKGVALVSMGRINQALEAYDDVLARFGDARAPVLQEWVATALVKEGMILVALGLASIVLGIRWLEHDQRVARWCFVLWALQVVIFALPSGSYSFFCGALVPLSWEFPFNLSITSPQLGMQFVARLNREGPVSYVGVNLIAVAACRFFLTEWRKA